uniref:ATP synthase F0 subunit 6 n=1 Tax=Tropilaelaps mercedesae TaxID=418985 RepID=UPI0028D03668|nr:ATP synthase F0 subunit 6 [Tropilaelaps mercedesae]WMV02015.1 ATP synthase F0 subunit 6 [Tropilaelaps mercedesae]
MLTNIFSIFDPSTSSLFSSNWLSMFLSFIFLPNIFWKFKSRINFSFSLLIKNILKEFKPNFMNNKLNSMILFLSLFWLIFFYNFLGLFPYIFTPSSHLMISLSLALPLWTTLMMFNLMFKFNNFMKHMVPLGTPMILSSFMVIIETLSNIIRPLTLAIRLTANMIAGHLLINLLSSISEKMMMLFIPSLPILNCLLLLEISVAIIQSYVFTTLISLYYNEI